MLDTYWMVGTSMIPLAATEYETLADVLDTVAFRAGGAEAGEQAVFVWVLFRLGLPVETVTIINGRLVIELCRYPDFFDNIFSGP